MSATADPVNGLFTSRRERRLWLWALGVVVAIYATLGSAPAIAEALRDRNALDQTFFNVFVVLVAAMTVVGLSRRPGWREIGVGIAVISLAVNYLMHLPGFAGIVYFLMGPAHAVHGYLSGRRAERLRR